MKQLEIDKIRLDGGTQPRAEIDEAVVDQYAESLHAGDNFPAVVVFFDGAAYWLADGFHRVHAALRIGSTTIGADIEQGDRRAAVLYSVGANATHGLRRSNADKRRAVMVLLMDSEWGKWSDREIADRAAVTAPTVAKWRTELAPTVKHLQSPTRTSRDGRQRPSTQPKRENRQPELASSPAPIWDDEDVDRGETPTDAPSTDYIKLEQWAAMSAMQRADALGAPARGQFNQQKNDSIEWAQWSWNPVTGCLHNCPYCYARDIAERFYPQKFAPSLVPNRLRIPLTAKVPATAATNIGFKNVFTCSMADLFGRWVPSEWIEAVLDTVRRAPDWNFLLLTKFPQRLTEFSFPDNAWVGTSVDCQARVAVAESAFRKVKAAVKWLSCEPLIEPVKFTSLEMFQWIVIGGASASTQTPEYRPPFEWTADLHLTAVKHGLKVYHKTNLYDRPRHYPGEQPQVAVTPEQMRYLPTKAA